MCGPRELQQKERCQSGQIASEHGTQGEQTLPYPYICRLAVDQIVLSYSCLPEGKLSHAAPSHASPVSHLRALAVRPKQAGPNLAAQSIRLVSQKGSMSFRRPSCAWQANNCTQPCQPCKQAQTITDGTWVYTVVSTMCWVLAHLHSSSPECLLSLSMA